MEGPETLGHPWVGASACLPLCPLLPPCLVQLATLGTGRHSESKLEGCWVPLAMACQKSPTHLP